MEIRVKKKKSAKPSLHVAVVAFGLKGQCQGDWDFGVCFFWGNHFANPPFVLLGLALRRGGFYPPCGPLVDNVCG